MTSTRIADATLEVSFTGWEKVLGVLRDVKVPLQAIDTVDIPADGYREVHGFRAPGMSVPGVRKLGTWRSRGSTLLVSVRPGQPTVRLHLSGQRYSELLIGMRSADEAVELVRSLESGRR